MKDKFAGLALDVEKPSRMTIKHPITGQPLRTADGKEAWLDLYSGDSEVARRHDRAVSRRRLETARGRGRIKITPEEMEADAVEQVVALTHAWFLVDLAGKPIDVEFSQQNARELYANPAMTWLYDQAAAFAADRENFSKASSQRSPNMPSTSSVPAGG